MFVVLGLTGAYVALLVLAGHAPPPPALGRTVVPGFTPAIDGHWYSRDCGEFRILGGWILPDRNVVLRVHGRDLRVVEPIDLTRLATDGKAQTLKLDSETFSIRWQHGALTLEGTTGGRAAARFVARPSSRCRR